MVGMGNENLPYMVTVAHIYRGEWVGWGHYYRIRVTVTLGFV